MDQKEAIFLGILQGVSEFLPISSSGHLALFQVLFGQYHDLTFELLVHLATLLSVLTVMYKPILQLAYSLLLDIKKKQYGQGMDITFKIIVATFPAGFIGILFKDSLSALFSSLLTLAGGFFFTGVLLLMAVYKTPYKTFVMSPSHEKLAVTMHRISYLQALLIGCFQALALIPGISRSGSTIAGGLFLRLDPATATYFSFFLAIPTIIGAVILQLSLETPSLPFNTLFMGSLSAYVVGVFSLLLLFKMVRRGHLGYFAFYLFFLATLIFTKELIYS